MDKKLKGKIISSLRKLTFSYEPRNNAKKRNKVGKALYECEKCKCYCYDGKSDKSFEKLTEEFSDRVVKRGYDMDHIEPIIPIKKGWVWDWNDYLDRMFCGEDGISGLCKDCHKVKTDKEKALKAELRREK